MKKTIKTTTKKRSEWHIFMAKNMGAYMKKYGGHTQAMKHLSAAYKEYKKGCKK